MWDQKNKLWIWKAYDTYGGRLLDWECGHRDQATLERLLDRLEKHQVLFSSPMDMRLMLKRFRKESWLNPKRILMGLNGIIVDRNIGLLGLSENLLSFLNVQKW